MSELTGLFAEEPREILTVSESEELLSLEAVVSSGLQGFIEVGGALLSIRDRRLYRATHATFEDYMSGRWHMTRQHGNRLVKAAETVGAIAMEPIGSIPLPANEAQARPLGRLPSEERASAWQEAVERAGGQPTARDVTDVVMRRIAPTDSGASVPIDDSILIPGSEEYDGDEWYTPTEYVEAARKVLGRIGLDPASCPTAQGVVRAEKYYTKDDDGLLLPWRGTVFLNPPYSYPLVEQFTKRAVDLYRQGTIEAAIILTNNCTDAGWFHNIATSSGAFCFTRGRVQFWRDNQERFATRQGQVFFYLGPDVATFRATFAQFGMVASEMLP